MLYLLSKKAVKNENTEAKNNFPLTLEAKKDRLLYMKRPFFIPERRSFSGKRSRGNFICTAFYFLGRGFASRLQLRAESFSPCFCSKNQLKHDVELLFGYFEFEKQN